MKTVQLPLLVILFLIVLTVKDSSATNFNPSNYEIKNWLEVPGGGSIWGERRLQYLTKDDLFTQLGRKKGTVLFIDKGNQRRKKMRIYRTVPFYSHKT